VGAGVDLRQPTAMNTIAATVTMVAMVTIDRTEVMIVCSGHRCRAKPQAARFR
jgi:hypothetical protein